MRRAQLFLATFSCLLIFTSTSTADDADADPAKSVQQALDEMHDWVGTDYKGTGWRKYLRSEDLEAELAKGDQADVAVVSQILDRYSSDAVGLDRRRFVAVRDALSAWVEHLEPAAETEPAQDVPLPEIAENAKDAFEPVSEQAAKDAKAELSNAIQSLHQFLARGGQQKLAGWKKYLEWVELEQALQNDKPDLQVLNGTLAKFRGYHTGLELSQFTAVRDALFDYRNAVYFSSTPNIQEQYGFNLDRVAKALETYDENPNFEDASLIGHIIGWLASGGQAESLVESVRTRYGHPNLFARVSSRFVSRAMEREVDETTGLHDRVGGMSVSGVAHTTATVTAELVPNDEQAAFDIRMVGVANSNNVGSQGPVTVYATGVTSIDARKRVTIDAEGWESEPAIAYCATGTNVYALDAPLPIIRKIAWKQVGKRKGQGEIAASRRAAGRVAWRMDEQGGETLAKANESFIERFRKPLLRRGEFPRLLNFSTTSDHVLIRMLQANAFQIAAGGTPPEIPGDQDLAVRVHESLVSNLSEAALSGETVTNDGLRETLKDLTGKVPESLQPGPDTEPFSITFATVQPITANFNDETMTITIRGRQFTRGDQVYRDAMYITATYKVERSGSGAKLTRQGNVVADYHKEGKQSTRQIAFKNFLSQNFEKLFKEEFISEGLKLPEQYEKVGRLSLKHLHCDGGWLGLGWQAPAKDVRTADAQAKQ